MTPIDHTHDASASTWVEGADTHGDFPVQNLPLGIFAPPGGKPRTGTAIGDWIIDLTAVADLGGLPGTVIEALQDDRLNALFGRPSSERMALRHRLFEILTQPEMAVPLADHLYPAKACELHLPFRIGDYTDFYVGIHHATNIGKQFRPDTPLLPNYKHVPIAYHGRASSVRVSGTPVVRPKGQLMLPDAKQPIFGPSRRLDYEVELGLWVAGANDCGESVPIAAAQDRIGGYCLLNDWSARDIQAWEYQPLGPFLAKNFLTTVSPWIVTREAMAPFHQPQRPRPDDDPRPLPHLWDADDQARGALAISLEAMLTSPAMRAAGEPARCLSRVGAEMMYWTPAQMIAHHASNGCNLQPGDLLGTGTISGPCRDSFGSLMELTIGGRSPIRLPGGDMRTFLADGDEIVLRARAEKSGFRTIGFGPCAGTVAPATP